METRYLKQRQEIEEVFARASRLEDSVETHPSPSGKYSLETVQYKTGEDTWNYSRGLVRRTSDQVQIADIKRNYGIFWHAWVTHPNGFEYLLCGEDYQGYSVICLDTGENKTYFPPEAFDGTGFCWATVHPSPDGLTLAVEGCYWACPYELVFYDFSSPQDIPLLEIARIEDYFDATGWEDNTTFGYSMGESNAEREPALWRHPK
jgi:hypothetical protein